MLRYITVFAFFLFCASGLNAQKEYKVKISTELGDMIVKLYNDTPVHRDNFIKNVKNGWYDGTLFHRVMAGFMMQGGDPNSKDSDPSNDGAGGPGYTVPAEIMSSINHERGALGAARNNNPEKASNGSQFYICHSTSGTSGLDGNYTVFGMVMQGIEVIDSVVVQPKNTSNNRPFSDIKMDVNVLEKTVDEIKNEYGYDPTL